MNIRCTPILFIWLVVASFQVHAQTIEEVKAKIASNACDCLNQKSHDKALESLTKEQAKFITMQCFASAAGKELVGIQHAYGTDALTDNAVMKQIGVEVASAMTQDCPSFVMLSMSLAKEEEPSSTAATTGQTTGHLGSLHGAGIALLSLEISKTEQAQFAWLQRVPDSDGILAQLTNLKGQAVRISWQEVDVLDPGTSAYRKMRQIIGIKKQ